MKTLIEWAKEQKEKNPKIVKISKTRKKKYTYSPVDFACDGVFFYTKKKDNFAPSAYISQFDFADSVENCEITLKECL